MKLGRELLYQQANVLKMKNGIITIDVKEILAETLKRLQMPFS